jgi:nitrite reductase (NADH) small subunit/3-phenylpropionate/trans-cinnamate dioxygenase ferredoxin subunit
MDEDSAKIDWVMVAKTGDIPKNEGRAYPVGDRMIAVFESEGRYYALDDFCPHQGASLAAGWIHEGCVACPWHAWRFALSDGTWMDNRKIKTDHFDVQVRNSEIYVGIPK